MNTQATKTASAQASRPLRAMWLLNHSAARRFEVPMLKRMGIEEIFLPKTFPCEPSFRSASVEWDEDLNLSIPPDDLAALNSIDWYSGGSREGWDLANRHFDIVFFIVHSPFLLHQIASHFQGVALWRAYGLQKEISYDFVLNLERDGRLRRGVNHLGARFYLAEAYAHIADDEPDYLKARRLYLPLGISTDTKPYRWTGELDRVLFVCPEIAINPYYRAIYRQFKRDFGDLPHVIGGAQPIKVNDSNVLGFVTAEEHARNMTQNRVMYYHSTEPNHIHYHPFEAIQAGMPLLYMAGGILDRMGGIDLPGRCRTVQEARKKLQRILAGDTRLIDSIRNSQPRLLEPMSVAACMPAWTDSFARLRSDMQTQRLERLARPSIRRQKRIAVCMPIAYQGGTLRGAQALAHALLSGSQQAGEPAEIVLLYPEDAEYRPADWQKLPSEISRRSFSWHVLDSSEATRAMHYAGFTGWEPNAERFMVPDDGIQQLQDCDLWVFVSDRLSIPILPLRPQILVVYDYLQRYENVMPVGHDHAFLSAAFRAHRVLVTTRFTRQDALQYAGLRPHKVRKMPMLAPDLNQPDVTAAKGGYFVWPTNKAIHKNHSNAAEALRIYYGELEGEWDCFVTGQDKHQLLQSGLPHLQSLSDTFKGSKELRKRVHWKGNLDDRQYHQTLASANALWLPTRIDNGSFSVIEAGQLGVPSLCVDYPAMREINEQFHLDLTWMDGNDPRQMALQLKDMEHKAQSLSARLAAIDCLAGQRVDDLASAYWQEVRECL
jgi:glycosyltransferase involved in cell wall biosynthesis